MTLCFTFPLLYTAARQRKHVIEIRSMLITETCTNCDSHALCWLTCDLKPMCYWAAVACGVRCEWGCSRSQKPVQICVAGVGKPRSTPRPPFPFHFGYIADIGHEHVRRPSVVIGTCSSVSGGVHWSCRRCIRCKYSIRVLCKKDMTIVQIAISGAWLANVIARVFIGMCGGWCICDILVSTTPTLTLTPLPTTLSNSHSPLPRPCSPGLLSYYFSRTGCFTSHGYSSIFDNPRSFSIRCLVCCLHPLPPSAA